MKITQALHDKIKPELIQIPDRVRNGINYLNKRIPKFFKGVKVGKINLRYCESCVLSQIFSNDYYKIIKMLNLTNGKQITLGFNAPSEIPKDSKEWEYYFSQLTSQWKIEISELKVNNK